MVQEDFIKVATLRGAPFHHCFVSLPHHWVQLIRVDTLPTFLIEGKDGSVLTVSWAGDVHEGCQGKADEVRLGHRLLVGSWEEGAEVVLTQVKLPGVCEGLCVTLGTQIEWEELVLNAEVAEISLLSQVRVVRRGQILPLWLEGGAQVMLKVIELNPKAEVGLLQSLTRVEVLPPSEGRGDDKRTEKMCFTPVETEQRGSAGNGNSHGKPSGQLDNSSESVENSSENNMLKTLEPLRNFIDRRKKLEVTEKLADDCDIYCRVHPLPVGESYFLSCLPVMSVHPSLVIISKKTLPTCLDQTIESFSCTLARIQSPKQLSEQWNDESKDMRNKPDVDSISVTVLVWENYFGSEELTAWEDRINPFIHKGCAVVSSSLRRSYELSISSQIILKPLDSRGRVSPLSIDVVILQAPSDMCEDLLIAKFREKIKECLNISEIILNDKAVVEIPLESKHAEFFVSIQDREPLRVTKESVVMLDINVTKTKSPVESVPKSLNETLVENDKCYIHDKQLMVKMKKCILLGLGLLSPKLPSIPQNILLQGSKGRGKTTLLTSLTSSLAQEPYFIHCQTLHLKSLKGKKVDILEKKIQEALQEAIYRKPSLVLLEDIDYLMGVSGQSEQESGPEYEHRMHMVSVICHLVDQLMQYQHAKKNDLVSRGVVIIATCLSRTKVNRSLVAPQGHHYFPISFTMRNLEPQDAVKIFKGVVSNYFSQFFSLSKEADGNFKVLQRPLEGKYIEPEERHEFCCIKDSKLMRWIEGFSIMDIDHLALRAVIQAKVRQNGRIKVREAMYGKEDSQIDCFSSPKVVENGKNRRKTTSSCTWEVLEEDVEIALVDFIPSTLRALPEKSKKGHIIIQVGGLTEAQHTLKETLTWPTRYPKLFAKSSLRLRSGILLYGPPGCGKTLLANAFAQSTSIHFISVKGPELLSKYIGASEEAVRNAFERAQNARPCILFFDEFESIAPRRGHDSTGVTDRVVNQLLTQMDGVEGLTGVFLLAATSRPDLVDPALLRPGRLDKCVFCPLPSEEDRVSILKALSTNLDLAEEIDWVEAARATEHFSGADLQSLLSTAQILAAREVLSSLMVHKSVNMQDDHREKSNNQEATEWTESSGLSTDEEDLHSDQVKQHSTDSTSGTGGQTSDEYSVIDGDEPCEVNMPSSLENTESEEEEVILHQVILEKDRELVLYKQTVGVGPQELNKVKDEDVVTSPYVGNHYFRDGETYDIVSPQKVQVRQEHVQKALLQVKPSVSQGDRLRYEKLYETFMNRREGDFGNPSPGKRATLA